MKAKHIIWDTDENDDCSLPDEIEIPEEIEEDEVSDYLSDLTGYCHKGYFLED